MTLSSYRHSAGARFLFFLVLPWNLRVLLSLLYAYPLFSPSHFDEWKF